MGVAKFKRNRLYCCAPWPLYKRDRNESVSHRNAELIIRAIRANAVSLRSVLSFSSSFNGLIKCLKTRFSFCLDLAVRLDRYWYSTRDGGLSRTRSGSWKAFISRLALFEGAIVVGVTRPAFDILVQKLSTEILLADDRIDPDSNLGAYRLMAYKGILKDYERSSDEWGKGNEKLVRSLWDLAAIKHKNEIARWK